MEHETRETWSKRVERWKESGLSSKEFASELGINAHSLLWWKWRLAAEAKGKIFAPPRRRAKLRTTAKKTTRKEGLTFIEMSAPATRDALEIALSSTTFFVRVRAGFDDATLGRALDLLERRR
jgi:hypothetical protein